MITRSLKRNINFTQYPSLIHKQQVNQYMVKFIEWLNDIHQHQ